MDRFFNTFISLGNRFDSEHQHDLDSHRERKHVCIILLFHPHSLLWKYMLCFFIKIKLSTCN